VTSAVLPGSVAVGAGLDQRGARVSVHLSPSPGATRVTLHRNDALTVQHPELASPPPTDTDDLITTAPPAPNHVHDELTTTASTVDSTIEVAALEALRDALARSESLATLAPRLANVDAWISKETPPDRSRELQWAADGLHHAQRSCRPGHLTRAGREDRRRLDVAQARYDALVAHQDGRAAWLEDHADTLAYRDELAAAVTRRRRELAAAAAIPQPDHVVDLIGAVATDNPAALQRWTNMAGRIEAYREEWDVEPERLAERPRDLCQGQGQAWEAAVHAAQLLSEPPAPVVERGLDRGLGLEL
jgi:hypothetical protein